MMNKRIRTMIDEIFSEMKMTAENLALRDELMANALARYEDVMSQGKSEEDAFAEVAASLEDVHTLLHEMNAAPQEEPSKDKKKGVVIDLHIDTGKTEGDAHEDEDNDWDDEEDEHADEDEEPAQQADGAASEFDLSETLNKAFSALGSFGKSIMPQAKKLVRDVDDATGGAIKNMGKAVNRSMKDAQKAAGDAIDKMSDMSGELVFDFGKREEPKKPQGKTPEMLREEAQNIRAEAEFKQVTGDEAGAQAMREQAAALETQADALEQAQAMAEAQKAAAEEAARAAAQQGDAQVDIPELEEKAEPVLDEDGDVNEDAFAKVVEQIQRDAQKMAGDAEQVIRDAVGGEEKAEDADYTVTGETTASGSRLFPAAGLRMVDIELDADDVKVEASENGMVEVVWSARGVEGEPEIWMDGYKLKIRRKNPDVFKTFFSVFSKNGGEVTVRVPRGYAADYKLATTSGDIHLYELDVDSVKASATSGSIRLEPDASVRADLVKADTVSGDVTVSACANDVKVDTVSGAQFISCDAGKVKSDTVSGKVHIEGACDVWEIDSVSGGVELLCTVVPMQKIDIDTVSATARVALPGEIRGFVADISSMSGKIVNEFGPNRYGTCALPIHMDSMSGSLMITRL